MYIYKCLEAWHNCHNIGDAFSDEQLFVLGVKREYFYYFHDLIDKERKERKQWIKEYIYHPESKEIKNGLRWVGNSLRSLIIFTYSIYRDSFDILSNPKMYYGGDIYWWMGARPNLFDTPELQKYKLLPNKDADTIFSTPIIKQSCFKSIGRPKLKPEEWETRY